MKNSLKKLKEKKSEIKLKEKIKNTFSKIEKVKTKTMYHTKVFNDLFTFGISQKEEGKFFIALRGLFDNENRSTFHLFSIKDRNDKFLGMFYGFRRLKNSILLRYKDNIKQSSEVITIYKPYYIEFRFKKGSIFCYIKAIHALTKKEKLEKNYAQNLLERIITLENEVYKFYNKKRPDGGIITKWIKKNQK
ncbi:DUF226 domain-containing protein [Borrelia miyamotoi]|uniref:DUF226 domain-containing protein n=1 Tax=Borrelia miyamotoi TaxID=47466 RepID=A0AAQ2WZE5_9SPIR|nr:DUF226 domain-containing protein [Borrelia miyamotoi]AOW96128.1 partition protein [Borrelia miyamotoi]QTL84239.1 DUF226 domain-containing protein [Borrelia miyamotoi]WAZ85888.1 DUF226 domain-containing protein [Borrelia miyamotoi]WAZ91670.1 DUF226 domain-containing protein [Borrelia miyamotoi]WAZ92961.1 DUF226 domain-containing protein [Borrelia miyamotoi]